MLRRKQRDLGIGTSHRAFASERLLMAITAIARLRVCACERVCTRARKTTPYTREGSRCTFSSIPTGHYERQQITAASTLLLAVILQHVVRRALCMRQDES